MTRGHHTIVNQDRLGTATRLHANEVSLGSERARTIIAGRWHGSHLSHGNPEGHGGTGDVLTAWSAACSLKALSMGRGMYRDLLSRLAGDLAANLYGQAGMLARDLIQQIPHALTPSRPRKSTAALTLDGRGVWTLSPSANMAHRLRSPRQTHRLGGVLANPSGRRGGALFENLEQKNSLVRALPKDACRTDKGQ